MFSYNSSKIKIFANIYFCAIRRWGLYSLSDNPDDLSRAEEEKQTALMALSIVSKASGGVSKPPGLSYFSLS